MAGVPVRSPLLKRDRLDIWTDLIPFGTDDAGRLVELDIKWLHSLISGITGCGKSYSVRLLALGLALDPTVRQMIFDATAAADFRDFELVADRVGFGADDDVCRRLRDTLRELV